METSYPLPDIPHEKAKRELEEIYAQMAQLYDRARELEAVLGLNRGAQQSAKVRASSAAAKATKIRSLYVELGGGSAVRREICARLCVSLSTVSRALKAQGIS